MVGWQERRLVGWNGYRCQVGLLYGAREDKLSHGSYRVSLNKFRQESDTSHLHFRKLFLGTVLKMN